MKRIVEKVFGKIFSKTRKFFPVVNEQGIAEKPKKFFPVVNEQGIAEKPKKFYPVTECERLLEQRRIGYYGNGTCTENF